MRHAACLFIASALLVNTANAVTVYAPNNLARPYPFTVPDELIVFDSKNPDGFTIIGSMGIPNISFGGMAFDGDGNLWAYASLYKSTGGAAAGLYSVNMTTGAATAQGTLSTQSLQDIAFNPVDGEMYGINTQNGVTTLYTIDLTTGVVTAEGAFTGLPDPHHVQGFAIDSEGNYYLQELRTSNSIYKGAGLAVEQLYVLPQQTGYSQGMDIDWSRNNRGYHNAVGQGVFPDYYSMINYFAPDGSGYVEGPAFEVERYEGYGYPVVEAGDLAVMPAITPCYGDINADGEVNLSDLAQLLASYGLAEGAAYESGDLDGDADVDLGDLAGLLSAYGTVCD